MKTNVPYRLPVLIALMALLSLSSRAAEPLKEQDVKVLFRIERSRDADEVWYTLNVDEHGVPHREMPVNVFWFRRGSGNRFKPLTGIQQKFSYGIHSVNSDSYGTDAWTFRLAVYKARTFILRKTGGGPYRVHTHSNGSEVEEIITGHN